MRLFVAVFPDEAVNAAVDAVVADLDRDRWRPVARERRHVTLRFHADADPGAVAADLRRGLAGGTATTGLHCAGAGVFGSALWLGVHPDDEPAWQRVLQAVATDPADHVAHLTVARGSGPVPAALRDHHGPRWRPDAVALVASGTPYRVLERLPLVGAPGADEAVGGPR
ncbi:2'-5' RNA ligase family protein [Actinomycetospora chiangmaiensis]|uniref:2'-5' RNA ligase family protein n=1 Tax=Actinomycetospora chiangmaiensis TaxID=402650 RepID=UPI0003689702|nr:2'-5' RNA ligase family protein [Actinomycetospora chiangmaiensis]